MMRKNQRISSKNHTETEKNRGKSKKKTKKKSEEIRKKFQKNSEKDPDLARIFCISQGPDYLICFQWFQYFDGASPQLWKKKIFTFSLFVYVIHFLEETGSPLEIIEKKKTKNLYTADSQLQKNKFLPS